MILGLGSVRLTPEVVKRAYRQACKVTHPDAGGNPAEFAKVQAAYDMLKLIRDDGTFASGDGRAGDWGYGRNPFVHKSQGAKETSQTASGSAQSVAKSIFNKGYNSACLQVIQKLREAVLRVQSGELKGWVEIESLIIMIQNMEKH